MHQRFAELPDTVRAVVLHGEGRDTTGKGNADAMITATMERIDDTSSKCVVSTDLRVTGKVAQFGRGIMADVSKKLMAQFADNLNTMLDQSGDAVETPAETVADAPADTAAGSATDTAAADAEVPAAADTAAASEPAPAPTVRKIDGPANEPIELSGLAGTAVLKRLLPALGGLVVLLLVFRRFGKR